ncbi:MAG: MotA/TolQ/ExbB proton channel family protein [Elusimicrobia bacterium]|nr:MotA/TolQ/ExbB proton channel family protein [Elusimicrobiota bacterium]
MNWTFLLGVLCAAGAGVYVGGVNGRSMLNLHGVGIVLGGTAVAVLINAPWRQVLSAVTGTLALFSPRGVPEPGEIVARMALLARRAQSEGGLLSLQGEGGNFAGGFLERAVSVAIAAGESNETRRLLESEIRQMRLRRQEDANILRTMGTLSPMFGLLGTLLGMIRVLEQLSSPTKIGPAMALALSSAFIGIAFANLVCVPVSGQLRLRAILETLALEMIMERVLDIAAGKPPSLVELHLQGYAGQRPRAVAAAPPASAAEPA